jgi:carbon monoxide dehydrogenase subunit G
MTGTYYINQEDEPNVYCVNGTGHTVMFDRFVRVQLLGDAFRTVVI